MAKSKHRKLNAKSSTVRKVTAVVPRARGKSNKPVLQEIAAVGIRDRYSSYPSYGLTPERLTSILRSADTGDIFAQSELMEEMLEKDMDLAGMFASRRLAVTKCNYDILSDEDDPNGAERADEVQNMLNRIDNFDSAKDDLLDAVPKGFSALEIFWIVRDGKYEIEKIEKRHQKQFRYGKVDGTGDPTDLRFVVSPDKTETFRGLVTPEDLSRASVDGISLRDYPAIRRRFIISHLKARSSDPARAALLRGCAFPWLLNNFSVKWRAEFLEMILGIRVGKYDPNQPDQMQVLYDALQSLRTDTAAVISKDSIIELMQLEKMGETHKAYGDFADWISKRYSIAILGHEGSAKSTPGQLGQNTTALEAKQDLIDADARKVLDEPISNDIIRAYLEFNYGPLEFYPYHQTDTSRIPDLSKEVEVDLGLQKMGYPITKQYISEKYGRPLPGNDDEILTPVSGGPSAPPPDPTAIAAKKKLLGKR